MEAPELSLAALRAALLPRVYTDAELQVEQYVDDDDDARQVVSAQCGARSTFASLEASARSQPTCGSVGCQGLCTQSEPARTPVCLHLSGDAPALHLAATTLTTERCVVTLNVRRPSRTSFVRSCSRLSRTT